MGVNIFPKGLEEISFKRVPGGWVFKTVSPWILAPGRTYLVSDAQKPAIAQRVRGGMYLSIGLMLAITAGLIPAFVYFPSLRAPQALSAWAAYTAIVLAITVVMLFSNYLYIRPLLAGLARSTEKLGYKDIFRRGSEALSMKALAMVSALFACSAVITAVQVGARAGANLWSALNIAFLFIAAAIFVGMLVAKLCAKRDTSL